MDRTHLLRRHQTWHARLAIPPSLRRYFGGRCEFLQSLKTADLREASSLKLRVIAGWKEQLANVAQRVTTDASDAATVVEAAAALHADGGSPENAELALDVALEQWADAASKKYGVDTEGHPKAPEAAYRVLRMASTVLETGEAVLLSQAFKQYQAECALRNLRKQTIREKERTFEAFAEWLGADRVVTDITRRTAGRYVSDSLVPRGQSIKTIKDTIGHLSAFFEWMLSRGQFGLESNPWHGVSKSVRPNTRGTKPKRRAWTDDELKGLLEGIKTDHPLWPMTVIAAYSGMRREEIASLRTEDVTDGALRVTEGKTRAAVRAVPIHPVIAPLIDCLKEQSRDGYLISGLLTGGADDKRGHYVGKQFSDRKDKLGFTDPALNFHTLRNAFMQRCEEAEVPESTVKLIVGHSRPSLTFGGYSKGVSLDRLSQAVSKVTYGPADAVVAARAPDVKLKRGQGRRHRKG